ncbi:hypothetical protein GQ44DRAFT_47167 [Phaeosphaeriaceae sp. PMI808]|nr:hypothetical protein GQ44DRAFT_47167 [Phaeosphaeriaceae sp. PMI808]
MKNGRTDCCLARQIVAISNPTLTNFISRSTVRYENNGACKLLKLLNTSTGKGLSTQISAQQIFLCEALDVFGELLPDDPFSDPWLTGDQPKSPKLDIYSLGIITYIIMTGHQPFHDGLAPEGEERLNYMDRVRKNLRRGAISRPRRRIICRHYLRMLLRASF